MELKSQEQTLRALGYTPEIMSKLLNSDSESGGETLRRVLTVKGYESEIRHQKDNLETVGGNIQAALRELKKWEITLSSTKDEYNDVSGRARVQEHPIQAEAVNTQRGARRQPTSPH